MKKIILIITFLMSVNLFAALPPFYQGKKEILAILNDEKLNQELGSAEMIEKIKKVDDGYIIYTRKYKIKVDVKYLPTDYLGPAKFELEFQEKELRFIGL